MFSWFKKRLGTGNEAEVQSVIQPAQAVADASVQSPAKLAPVAVQLSAVGSLLEQAHHLFAAGKLDEAEDYYQQVLALDPQDAQVHNKLGDIAYERGHLAVAEAAYRRALEIAPGFGDAAINLGLTLDGQGRSAEAEATYQQLIVREPGNAVAQFNLAANLTVQNRLPEAEASYRQAIQINPAFSFAHFNLGTLLQGQNRLDEAESCFRRVLEINPDSVNTYANLGGILLTQARYAEAEALLKQASNAAPVSPQLLWMLSNALLAQAKGAEADTWLWRLLEVQPTHAEARAILLETLSAQDRLVQADSHYQRLIASVTEDANWHFQLGDRQAQLRHMAEAVACYQVAIRIKPDFAEAHFNLGGIQIGQGLTASAERSFRAVLAINPQHAYAHINLALLLMGQHKPEEAEASCRSAIEHAPQTGDFYCILASILKSQGKMADAEQALKQALEVDPGLVDQRLELASWKLFNMVENQATDPQALFAEHCRIGDIYEAGLRDAWPRHQNQRDPQKQLRVGFVSADLCNHAVASFIEPVLEHLTNASDIAVFIYYNNSVDDEITYRIRSRFRHWRKVAGLSDADLVTQITQDGVDILIDLSSHTSMHRLQAFAYKPAPVQVSWMGYPGTTGFRSVDYFLSDRFILPPGQFESQFVEKIVRLPANAPFKSTVNPPDLVALPALAKGHVTFGSFNRVGKINAEVVAIWARVLQSVPNSRMLLGSMPADGEHPAILGWFADAGISADRLTFEPHCDLRKYLMLHQQVDICLDTFPYSGGTTTMYAVWMGVPTVTLHGQTIPSRTSTSIMGHLGLDNYIAGDADEFVRKAVAAATDLDSLANLRMSMRTSIQQSVPGRPELIARGLQRALRIMWQNWCQGLPAQSFEVLEKDLNHAQ
jgi:protein O-GlcNAc transferase